MHTVHRVIEKEFHCMEGQRENLSPNLEADLLEYHVEKGPHFCKQFFAVLQTGTYQNTLERESLEPASNRFKLCLLEMIGFHFAAQCSARLKKCVTKKTRKNKTVVRVERESSDRRMEKEIMGESPSSTYRTCNEIGNKQ